MKLLADFVSCNVSEGLNFIHKYFNYTGLTVASGSSFLEFLVALGDLLSIKTKKNGIVMCNVSVLNKH